MRELNSNIMLDELLLTVKCIIVNAIILIM